MTGQKTALLCASGTISGLSAVVVCFNPKFGAGRFGPAENEHFLKAANFAIEKKVDRFGLLFIKVLALMFILESWVSLV